MTDSVLQELYCWIATAGTNSKVQRGLDPQASSDRPTTRLRAVFLPSWVARQGCFACVAAEFGAEFRAQLVSEDFLRAGCKYVRLDRRAHWLRRSHHVSSEFAYLTHPFSRDLHPLF